MKKPIVFTREQFVKLFESTLTSYQSLATELKAYEATFELIRQVSAARPNVSITARDLDDALVAARIAPLLLEKVRSQFDELREKFRQLVNEAQTPEAVLEAFEKLTETKLPN